jgi:hypothetical protein
VKVLAGIYIVAGALFSVPALAQAVQERIAVVDPTENVKALVLLEAKRQDELRQASDKFNAASIANGIQTFQIQHRDLQEIITLRSDYDEKLRAAEKGRIDAIRLVDVNAVAVASQKADQQATTLAKQVTDSAEALRKSAADSADRLAALVTSTAAAASTAQQQQFTQVNTQIQQLSTRITTLEQSGAGIAGKGEGVNTVMAILAAVAGLVIGLLAIGVPLLIRRNGGSGYYPSGVPRGG